MDAVLKLDKYDKIAITVSSGIDSMLMLAMIKQAFPTKKILAITTNLYKMKSEYEMARQYTERFEKNFEHVQIGEFSIVKNLQKLNNYSDDFRWNTYTCFAPEYAKEQDYDVLVTGDGADELFAGYTFRYESWNNGSSYMQCHHNDFTDDLYDLIGGKVMYGFSPNSIYDVMRYDFNGKLLHDFIPTIKKIESKTLPIESPFLDKPVIEYARHLPIEEKYDGDIGKIHLRTLCDKYGVPQRFEKVPFSPNIVDDWRDNGNPEFLLDQTLKIYDYLNYDWVKKHLHEAQYYLRYTNKMLQLICLEMKLRDEAR